MILLPVLCILLSLLYFYLTQNDNYWRKRGIPHTKPQLFFGSLKELFLRRENIGLFLARIYNSHKADAIGIWSIRTPTLVLKNPDLIKDILIQNYTKFGDRFPEDLSKCNSITAKSIFFVNLKKWRQIRQKTAPIFSSIKMQNMMPLIKKTCNDLKDFMEKINNDFIETKELTAKYTTDIIASCIFGVEGKCFKEKNSLFRQAGYSMLSPTLENGIRQSCYLMAPSLIKLFNFEFVSNKSLKYFKNVFTQASRLREESGIRRPDLIDAMIQIKEEQTKMGIKTDENENVAQAIIFLSAGYETTSTTITFCLYELAIHEDIQEKLRIEMVSILKKYSGLTYEAIKSMEYLNMVLLETLRKYPPLSFIHRYCIEKHEVNNLSIEVGTPIYVPILGIHRDEQYYPEPEKFLPERFTPEEIAARNESVFLPFGLGPKRCIGDRMGVLVAKMCLCHIILNYKLMKCVNTPSKIEFNPRMTPLQSKVGIPLKYIKLKNEFNL